jgi:hypothetical protein
MNRIMKRMALPVGAAIVLGSSGFAFMAQATVPETFAGQGQNVIDAANVSNVHYAVHDHGVNYIDNDISSVTFTLDKAPVNGQTVYAVIQDGNTNNHNYPGTTSNSGNYHKYANCVLDSGGSTGATYTCSIGPNQYSSAKLVSMNELYVIAAQ